jgi:uncharacterized protein
VELQNRFEVPISADEAFATLLDLERVAPCMPGAQLLGNDGDDYHGRLKLRIGPITVAYEGTVTVEQADKGQREARLRAIGNELGGQGTANATVSASVHELGASRCEVQVVTDLDVRGKAAQFGRGALGEVTQRVLDQFARNLEATVGAQTWAGSSPDGPSAAPATAAAAPGSEAAALESDAGLDVLSVVWRPIVSRALPVVAGLVVGFLLGRAVGSRGQATPAGPGPARVPGWGSPGWPGAAPWPPSHAWPEDAGWTMGQPTGVR